MSARPSATDRLSNPDAVLYRSDLAALGYERTAIDAYFRVCPVEQPEGTHRPVIRVRDFLEARERATYRGDRVRACRRPAGVS